MKRPSKRKNIAADFFEDLLSEPVEIPSFITEQMKEANENSKREQTDNKRITNRQQTGNKQATETDNKQVTNGYQGTVGKIETDNKRVTKRVTEQITIGQQTDNKQITKSSFEELVGNEKKLLRFIFNECLRIGSLTTPEITLTAISQSLEISSGVAKMTIHRLVNKEIIQRSNSKTGRGGWIKFSISKTLYQDLRIRETDNKQITNGYQTDNKQVTKRVTEQITSSPVSKLDSINTYLTNTADAWELSILDSVQIYGINEGIIKRARKISPTLEIDQVCLVIEKFKFVMDGPGGKNIFNKVGYFLSLTKQIANGVDVLPEIESETDRLMRDMILKAKGVTEDRKKLEEELFEASFEEWMGSLTRSSRLEMAPDSTLVKEGSHPYNLHFKNHYRANVWPEKMQNVVQGRT